MYEYGAERLMYELAIDDISEIRVDERLWNQVPGP